MIKPLIYISINNASAESLKYTKGFPSPDTLLRRLKSLDLKHVVKAFCLSILNLRMKKFLIKIMKR